MTSDLDRILRFHPWKLVGEKDEVGKNKKLQESLHNLDTTVHNLWPPLPHTYGKTAHRHAQACRASCPNASCPLLGMHHAPCVALPSEWLTMPRGWGTGGRVVVLRLSCYERLADSRDRTNPICTMYKTGLDRFITVNGLKMGKYGLGFF